MEAGRRYTVEYALSLDSDVYELSPRPVGDDFHTIVHSNIHSCPAARGACTPFVEDSPGLSTHTSAAYANLTSVRGSASKVMASFQVEVVLPAGSYTVIVHNRFYVPDTAKDPTRSCRPDCLVRIDAAAGEIHTVLAGDVSIDAYIAAGTVGVLALCGVGSVICAARAGRLNVGRLIHALIREQVALPMNIVMSLGNVCAATVCFITEILNHPALTQIIPIAAFFTVLAWFITSVNVGVDTVLLWDMHTQRRRAATQVGEHLGVPSLGVLGRLSVKSSESGMVLRLKSEHAMAAFVDLAAAERDVKSHYLGISSLLLQDLPLVALAAYILVFSKVVSAIVVLDLSTSCIMAGMKVAYAAHCPAALRKRDLLRLRFERQVNLATAEAGAVTPSESTAETGAVTPSLSVTSVWPEARMDLRTKTISFWCDDQPRAVVAEDSEESSFPEWLRCDARTCTV